MASRYALVSHSPSDNCDILIVGKTRMGRSTTGNKLLGTHSTDESSTEYFLTGSGIEPVTKECQLCKNDGVRVLDTPGFADNKDTKEHGVFESNRQIFHSIVQEQEKHNLQFSRVLYFLPTRGSLERADGVLQEEIKAMHVFFGDDIFNIMVLITTNHPKHQDEFLEEDFEQTRCVFMKAFQTIIGKSLRKCPPILYFPVEEKEDNILRKIVSAKVIDDKQLVVPQEEETIHKPIKVKAIPEYPLTTKRENVLEPEKAEKTENVHRQNVMETAVSRDTVPRELEVDSENKRSNNLCHDKQSTSGKKWTFEDRCTRCSCKISYESTSREATKTPVTIVTQNDEVVPYEGSMCHPFFTPKYSDKTKSTEGHVVKRGLFAAVATICRPIFQGFTNLDEVCARCKNLPGSEGCSVVGDFVDVPTGKGPEIIKVKVSHLTKLDSPPN